MLQEPREGRNESGTDWAFQGTPVQGDKRLRRKSGLQVAYGWQSETDASTSLTPARFHEVSTWLFPSLLPLGSPHHLFFFFPFPFLPRSRYIFPENTAWVRTGTVNGPLISFHRLNSGHFGDRKAKGEGERGREERVWRRWGRGNPGL